MVDARLAVALLSVAALAGCAAGPYGAYHGAMGNVATVSGNGYSSGTQTKTLQCSTDGQIAFGSQGTGMLTVKVKDSSQAVLYSQTVTSSQQGSAQTLSGQAGTWTLTVSTGLGYSGAYGLSLSC